MTPIDADTTSSAGYAERLSRGHHRGKLNLAPDLDSPLIVQRKCAHLAHLIKNSEHVVLHTGAGLSTSAGVSDFRGPKGIWTNEVRKRAAEKKEPAPKRSKYTETNSEDESSNSDVYEMAEEREDHEEWDEPPIVRATEFEHAVPTLSHMVIAEMVRLNLVQSIVTQNVDCLHLRSGVPRANLAEIHGNLMMEWCPKCCIEYQRDFEIRTSGFKPTGRVCVKCGEALTDKQLDWENALPEEDEAKAETGREKGDLHIVIGSSNQMVPAREYPFRKGRKQQSVIVNLSPTPKDDSAGMVIRARCDTVLAIVADYLKIVIPDWQYKTELTFKAWTMKEGQLGIGLYTSLGKDLNCEAPIPFIKSTNLKANNTDADALQRISQTKWVLDVSEHCMEGNIDLSCEVVLKNGVNGVFNLTFCREDIFTTKQLIVQYVRHLDAAKREVNLLKRKMRDSCNWKHLARAPRTWFISASKPRYSMCILCKQVLYSGSGRWLSKAIEHLQACVERTIGSNSERETSAVT